MHGTSVRTLRALALAAVSVAGACRSTPAPSSGPRWEENGRLARNLPTMFLADTTNRAAQTTLGPTCSTRLVDPRDGTLLMLERSQQAGLGSFGEVTRSPTRDNLPPTRPAQRDFRGDYSVAAPERYGLAADELLRIECVSGRGLGIVSKRWQ